VPRQEVPASVEIITKPRKQPNEGLRMAEAPSYTIKRYKLEYWYDDDETRKK
jgi:hypothetical protein